MNALEKINEVKERYKVVNKRLIDSNIQGYIGKKTYEYTLNDGTKKICDQITKRNTNGDAVTILPVLENNNLMLIIESRPNTDEEVVVEFPAGMIDGGETPLQAALRELSEETGLVPKRISLLEWHYQDQGCSKAKVYTFLATDCVKENNQSLDDSERIITIELTNDEVMELLNQNIISDANSKIAVLTYRR